MPGRTQPCLDLPCPAWRGRALHRNAKFLCITIAHTVYDTLAYVAIVAYNLFLCRAMLCRVRRSLAVYGIAQQCHA